MGGSGVLAGVFVRTADGAPPNIEAAAAALVRALLAVGLDTGRMAAFPKGEAIAGGFMGPTGIVPSGELRILVGSKP